MVADKRLEQSERRDGGVVLSPSFVPSAEIFPFPMIPSIFDTIPFFYLPSGPFTAEWTSTCSPWWWRLDVLFRIPMEGSLDGLGERDAARLDTQFQSVGEGERVGMAVSGEAGKSGAGLNVEAQVRGRDADGQGRSDRVKPGLELASGR